MSKKYCEVEVNIDKFSLSDDVVMTASSLDQTDKDNPEVDF